CHKNDAIRQFETPEVKLWIISKLEKLREEIRARIPDRIICGDELEGKCDDLCRAFVDVLIRFTVNG
ncbi:MAG: hypothetical protein V3S05_00920, partial [Desulfobacterales bacterium]